MILGYMFGTDRGFNCRCGMAALPPAFFRLAVEFIEWYGVLCMSVADASKMAIIVC
jgi:hypothetical protein